MKNAIREMILETINDFYEAGTVNEITLKEFKQLCLPKVKEYSPSAIARIRKRLHLSQSVFANFLNASASTVKKWELGSKHPSGIALKLLNIIDQKGLEGII